MNEIGKPLWFCRILSICGYKIHKYTYWAEKRNFSLFFCHLKTFHPFILKPSSLMTMACWCTLWGFTSSLVRKRKTFLLSLSSLPAFWWWWLIDKAQDDTWSSIMTKKKDVRWKRKFLYVLKEIKTNVWDISESRNRQKTFFSAFSPSSCRRTSLQSSHPFASMRCCVLWLWTMVKWEKYE